MPLIDDIEFYGRAVAAGELDRARAAELLARDSGSFFTVPCAASWIDGWEGVRARLDRIHSDVFHTLKAIENGRPVRYRALPPKLPAWEESPHEAARYDRHHFERDED
ncbi:MULTISPECIES: hypothetical protein [Streptomyces]|uniref:Uncharacterized protein n=1 Tax=Streptomyces dengpaensis TaxID=2049881 RepID=A0ABM6T000_9ACTN|nr:MULTISPECIES: hypothetical protein [Streptomyces]AVH59989.1 hypothetical protein C4B68_34125 [Streptomyces dengpaensis]PIB09627.1 hypothetical protein B1C81_10800 [Streptomyces sp. HG99]